MNEDAERESTRLKKEAKRHAKLTQEQAERDAERYVQRFMHDADLQQEWIRQNDLIYGGLMGIGIVMIQPFLAATSLDTSATICVVAFAIAIPLLAALIMVNRHETFRRRRTSSRVVEVARVVAQLSAFVGLVAGFWHIHWIAGAGILLSASVAVGVQSAGFTRLEAEIAEEEPQDPTQEPSSSDNDSTGQ